MDRRSEPSASAEAQVALAERIAQGDASAEEEFCLLFRPRVLALVVSRTGDRDAACDIAQEVMMAALESLRAGQVREPGNLSAFLYGIARNLVNRYFEGRSRRREQYLEPTLDIAVPAVETELSERVALVRQVVGILNAVDRKILLATLVDGLNPGQIAAQVGLTSEAVRQRKSRAVKRIIEAVAKRMSRKTPVIARASIKNNL